MGDKTGTYANEGGTEPERNVSPNSRDLTPTTPTQIVRRRCRSPFGVRGDRGIRRRPFEVSERGHESEKAGVRECESVSGVLSNDRRRRHRSFLGLRPFVRELLKAELIAATKPAPFSPQNK